MFLEMLLFALLGIVAGIVTGLIPGLHPNAVFAVFVSFSIFMQALPVLCMFTFIIALAVSNTFTDFIPSILFGAPEEDSVFSVLPGHKYLLEGRGYEALFLTVVGGLFVFTVTLLSSPFLLYAVPVIYTSIHGHVHVLLLLAVSWMILSEKRRKLAALSVFLISGIFGFVTLNSFTSELVLFPALTGLFALSTLLTSLNSGTNVPEQKLTREIHGDWIRGGVTGWLAGILAGMLPGLGAAQSGAIAAQALRSKTREFLIALGGINTSSIIFAFMMLYLLGKTRSGASWAISQVLYNFAVPELHIFFAVSAISVFISAIATLYMGKLLMRKFVMFDYAKMTKIIILSLVVLILAFTGIVGLLIAFTGMCTGLLAVKIGIRRTHLMGFLLLPTILYFSGLSPLMLHLL